MVLKSLLLQMAALSAVLSVRGIEEGSELIDTVAEFLV